MPVYRKLVRDRIPEIVLQGGKDCRFRVLEEEEYKIELRRKLHEELREYEAAIDDSAALEELADLLELIRAAADLHEGGFDRAEEIRRAKEESRGRFQKRLYLIEVDEE